MFGGKGQEFHLASDINILTFGLTLLPYWYHHIKVYKLSCGMVELRPGESNLL